MGGGAPVTLYEGSAAYLVILATVGAHTWWWLRLETRVLRRFYIHTTRAIYKLLAHSSVCVCVCARPIHTPYPAMSTRAHPRQCSRTTPSALAARPIAHPHPSVGVLTSVAERRLVDILNAGATITGRIGAPSASATAIGLRWDNHSGGVGARHHSRHRQHHRHRHHDVDSHRSQHRSTSTSTSPVRRRQSQRTEDTAGEFNAEWHGTSDENDHSSSGEGVSSSDDEASTPSDAAMVWGAIIHRIETNPRFERNMRRHAFKLMSEYDET